MHQWGVTTEHHLSDLLFAVQCKCTAVLLGRISTEVVFHNRRTIGLHEELNYRLVTDCVTP